MKYLEAAKGGTFTGSMYFFTFCMGPVPSRRHASLETRRGALSIGNTIFSHRVLPDCGKVTGPDAPAGFLPLTKKDCEARYAFLPENWGMIKTCGMGCSSLIISKKNMPSPSACGSAKGYSAGWDLPCKGLAARPVKLTPGMPSPAVEEVPRCQAREADPAQQEDFKKSSIGG